MHAIDAMEAGPGWNFLGAGMGETILALGFGLHTLEKLQTSGIALWKSAER